LRAPGHHHLIRANDLARYRCKSLRAHVQRLTKTAMARPWKKRRWRDHAQAMIEGTSVARAAERCDVHPHHGILMATPVSGLAGVGQAQDAGRNRRADETFILESFKGRRPDLPRQPRKRGDEAKRPVSCVESRKGAVA
jgi:hypothetical protein